ncbi:DUF1848 domain-containing protein [Azospirillum sp. ST 5-10]|uniref:DUF1848 domain-containing protein n=1 Tax=unclassified Azospirillum TaxID=2630922 RepID=UPI003F4A7602
MIVSASYRTDIPAFYGRWFLNRLAAGYARVANPYGGPPARVDLTPAAVDGFVFWTRNLAPFRPALDAVEGLGLPYVVQHSITALPRPLERSVVAWETAVAQVHALRRRHGRRAAVWRYDPVVTTTLTPPDWHRATFARLAGALAGTCDEVVVSFLQPYRKTARNLDRAAGEHGFSWRDPDATEKRALLADLAGLAAEHGMALTLCSQPDLLAGPGPAAVGPAGVGPARCIDAARLADVAGRPVAAPTRGNRPGCLCARSRDLGDYDTCPHGCVYCYAVADRDRAGARFRAHDPAGDFLFPPRRAAG